MSNNCECNPGFLSSDSIKYDGPNTPCVNVRTCDTITVAIQKIDEKICQINENSFFLTTLGTNGPATYIDGILNIPQYTSFPGTVTYVNSLNINSSGTDITSSVTDPTTTPTITLNIPTASSTSRGALSASDWSTFNSKEPAIAAGTTAQYWRGDKSWQTLNTSAVPEGSNLYFTTSRARTSLSFSAGSGNYDSVTGIITIPTDNNQIGNSAGYITTINGIAAGGDLNGTYPNPTFKNASVTGQLLSGVNITGGSISATDSILVAFGKIQNQINSLVGGSIYQGLWNASTNTPTITSSVGVQGHYYIVNVAGNTTIDGISDWQIGDWIIFNGSTWGKVDNTDAVISVNGQTGAVSLTTSNINEGTNLYYTDTRARAALSFAAGSGAYNSTTGVITIPTDNSQIANGAGYITSAALTNYVDLTTNQTVGGVKTFSNDLIVNTITVGRGGSSLATNTAIGFTALSSATTGDTNTAIGYEALKSLTTGTSNTIIGYRAGNFNTPILTGHENVLIGANVIASNSAPINQIIIGAGAAGAGNNTVRIGNNSITDNYFKGNIRAEAYIIYSGTSSQFLKADGSLDSNTYATVSSLTGYVTLTTDQNVGGRKSFTQGQIWFGANQTGQTVGGNSSGIFFGNTFSLGGTSNIIVGFESYGSGNQGIAIGSNANSGSSGASNNIAIGQKATEYISSGDQNIAIGTFTLNGLSTGSGNIGLGASAGHYIVGGITSMQTNTNSIFIGNGTRGTANGNTNEIVIGQEALGNGSNTVTIGNSSITNNYFNGSLRTTQDLYFTGGNNNKIEFVSEDGVIYTNGGSYITLGASGNAGNMVFDRTAASWGIGTANPTQRLEVNGNIRASSYIKVGGTSSQFLKADGSVDGTSYAPVSSLSSYALANLSNVNGVLSSTYGGAGSVNGILKANGSGVVSAAVAGTDYVVPSALSGYLPLSGGTLTGTLNGTIGNFSQYVAINRNGNNSVGAGAYVGLAQTSDAKQWLMQMNGSQGIDWWHFDGTSFSVPLVFNSNGSIVVQTTTASTSTTTGAFRVAGGVGIGGSLNGTSAAFSGGVNMATTSGSVGIGTVSPMALTELSKSTNSGIGATFPRLRISNSLATQGDGSSTFNFADINLSSGADAVQMFLATTFASGSTWEPAGIINVSTNHPLKFRTNGTDRGRITAAGRWLINTTTDNGTDALQVAGSGLFSGIGRVLKVISSNDEVPASFRSTSSAISTVGFRGTSSSEDFNVRVGTDGEDFVAYTSNSVRLRIGSGGAATFSSLGTGTVYSNAGTLTNTNPSDRNLKDNITSINYGLNEILQLNPVTFTWKDDKINQGKQFGFIAQEVQKIMPDLVKEGDYLGLDKEAIFTIMVKAIQEQQSKIQSLELMLQRNGIQ